MTYFYQLLFVLSWLGQNMPAHTSYITHTSCVTVQAHTSYTTHTSCVTVHHCNFMQLQTVTPKTVCASWLILILSV